MAKLAVIVFAPSDAQGAIHTVSSALQNAAHPENLCFLLPSYAQNDVVHALTMTETRFFPYEGGLPAAADQLGGGKHFLLLMGDWQLSENWDAQLYAQAGGKDHLLLTASVLTKDGCTDLCLPALKLPYDEWGIPLGHGLPLVCAQYPVSTLIADPSCLFGNADFLRIAKPDISVVSVVAYLAGYVIAIMQKPYMIPCSALPPRRLTRCTPDAVPGTSVARFEQLCGIHWQTQTLTVKAQFGLRESDNTYQQRFPIRSAAFQRMKGTFMRSSRIPSVVTGFVDYELPRCPFDEYFLHFYFLKELENLPLLVFTGGNGERTIRSVCPNHLSFPERALFGNRRKDHPRFADRFANMKMMDHFRRTKPFMMQIAAERHPERSHVAWVDFDVLPHPVCPGAVPDFTPLMDDRIHMAVVDGALDLSFILAPVALLGQVCHAAVSITDIDAVLNKDLSEENMWLQLMDKMPQSFCLHPMPRRQLLFLSLFDKALLSNRIAGYLNIPVEEGK